MIPAIRLWARTQKLLGNEFVNPDITGGLMLARSDGDEPARRLRGMIEGIQRRTPLIPLELITESEPERVEIFD